MRIFAIRNAAFDRHRDLGFFFYFEKINEYYIELMSNADEWELPFILDSFARKKCYTINQKYTKLFISQRIIPSDRQNIGMVLKDNHLEVYDEAKLFILADGRCAQDECFIIPVTSENLPDEIVRRRKKLIYSMTPARGTSYLLTCADGSAALVDLASLPEKKRFLRTESYINKLIHVLKNGCAPEIRSGGAEITWGHADGLTYELIWEGADPLPIDISALEAYVEGSVYSTQMITQKIGCSRQNISDSVKRGRIKPLELASKEQLFTASDFFKLL